MLMNNLDPDVAERPDDLVVYGGTGRAARSWDAFDAIVRELRALADDETLLVQSGKPVGVFRTHEWSPRVLIANSNLVGEWATWDEFRRLEAARADDVRADDRRLVDLHRQPGDRPGHLRVLRGDRPPALRRLARGDDHAHRRARRDGRRPAAGGDDERRRRALHRGRPRADRAPARDPLPRRAAPTTSTTRSTAASPPSASAARSASACARTRPRWSPSSCAAASRPTSSPTRPRPTTRWSATSRRASRSPRPTSCASATPTSYIDRARASAAAHCFAMVGFQDAGAEVFDYGNSLRREAELGGFERAFDYPGFVPAYIRPLFCEGKGPFRWAALSGDPADIAATDRAVLEEFPDDEALGALDPDGRRADRLPGPAGADLLARLRRAPAARAALQRMVAERRDQRPDRDRPRPPRLGLGRLALPRDRVDARRLRRDRRLAAAERARQHRLRARPGSASTTAAASASAARSTPGWSASPTAPSSPREKLDRVLTADPGMGVIRHADAGYERALEVAAERGVRVPMADPTTGDGPPIVELGDPVLRERAREVTRRGARIAGGPGADRRHDRDQARRERGRARRAAGRRAGCGSRSPRSSRTTRAIRTSRRSR